jgi:two-component system sensor kinase FixL
VWPRGTSAERLAARRQRREARVGVKGVQARTIQPDRSWTAHDNQSSASLPVVLVIQQTRLVVFFDGSVFPYIAHRKLAPVTQPENRARGTARVSPLPHTANRGSRYAVALAVFAACLLLQVAIGDALGGKVPYLPFYPAIVVAAWYGGAGPGLLVTTLSALAAMYVLLPPPGLAVADPSDRLALTAFVGVGAVISWLNHRLHAAQAMHHSMAVMSTARAERLDAILTLTVDGIIVIDDKGTIEAFNRGAQALFGYLEWEVIGRNVSVLMPSPHHEDHDTYLKRYLATGEARIIGAGREVTGRRRDGTMFPVQLSVREMRIAGERKFTGILHDLSKRADLEDALGASEARWRAVIDSAVDAIVVIDAHGAVETFNPAAERLFGYAAHEVLGRNVTVLMPGPYRDEHDAYLKRYLTTGAAKVIGAGREVQGRRKDGSTFPLHLSVGEFTINGERKFTGILHDLSRRVQMESQLREQAALARLGEMSAVIAHEVKNPLAGIRGAIQVLDSGIVRGDRNPRILKEIVARIDALNQMMHELLVFARPPMPRRVPIDIVPLLRATASLLHEDPAVRDVGIEIDGEAPPLDADPDMLRIVFQNLLINGAHSMQGRGRIRVAVSRVDGACEIAVHDDGPGIPPEIREKIFTPFFTTKSRGSGLGLPTAKRLIEAHDGEIAIECPPSGGTAVTIRLPL